MTRRAAACAAALLVIRCRGPLHTELAAAVILPVEAVFLRQLQGAQIAVLLLEVGGQVPDAELLLQLLPDGVDALGVLMGADGEGGGEPVEAVLGGILGSAAHPQPVADGAASAPLRLILKARHGGVELLRVVPVLHHRHPQRMGGGDEALQLLAPAVILGGGPCVGVVVEDGDVEILAQPLQHGAGARPTAGVQQQPGTGSAQSFQHFVHLL